MVFIVFTNFQYALKFSVYTTTFSASFAGSSDHDNDRTAARASPETLPELGPEKRAADAGASIADQVQKTLRNNIQWLYGDDQVEMERGFSVTSEVKTIFQLLDGCAAGTSAARRREPYGPTTAPSHRRGALNIFACHVDFSRIRVSTFSARIQLRLR